MFRGYNTYKDVELALNKALSYGGGKVDCQTPGMAYNWRQRAYRFRDRYRQWSHETYADIPERSSEAGTSPWDSMVLRTKGRFVEISFERADVSFISPDGFVESLVPQTESIPIELEEIEEVAEGAYRFGHDKPEA